ncbi:MAG: type II toxin-antitoxin system prevent-host-death family antitoxin [Opitutaceae bacterium]|jgi:prevent-host-death family protein|nr:type II toxin-antitoxin system prevent-host-death family antitoxin [Opitutaceae bacterium]
MKDTYSVRELQRDTAAAVRAAESGTLVTITRHERPVVHVISAERLGGMIETMELLADPKFMAALKKEKAGKGRYYPLSSIED